MFFIKKVTFIDILSELKRSVFIFSFRTDKRLIINEAVKIFCKTASLRLYAKKVDDGSDIYEIYYFDIFGKTNEKFPGLYKVIIK